MIYQNHIETLVKVLVIKYPTGLRLNVVIVVSFLQEQINKKDTLKTALVFPDIIYNFSNRN